MDKPQFLSQQDLVRYQKGACVLCNKDDFTRKVFTRETTFERRSHYEEWVEDRSIKYYIIADLNVYLLSFSFPHESQLDEHLQSLRTRIIEEKKQKAIDLKKGLEKTLKLPADQKKVAIDAVVADCLADLEHPRGFHGVDYSRLVLDDRLEKLKYVMLLGDLRLAGHGYVEGKGFGKEEIYLPTGIKVHPACIPFSGTLEKGILTRDVPFHVWYTALTRNPVFQNYDEAVGEVKDIFNWVRSEPLSITVKQYNPVEFVGL